MLTNERLKEVLHYDSLTGMFTWKLSVTNSVRVGDVAGHVKNNGYAQVSIDGKKYYLHRLAWFYIYNVWPPVGYEIDHKDLIKNNNRIKNLRLSTRTTNNQNVIVKSISATQAKMCIGRLDVVNIGLV